ncbi:hypothetical protein [Halegenticoccus soli]|nr:hypothetical protein [Halegenticoccus soli]
MVQTRSESTDDLEDVFRARSPGESGQPTAARAPAAPRGARIANGGVIVR